MPSCCSRRRRRRLTSRCRLSTQPNAGLDALAQLCQARGKPGLSVNWGVLRGGGMAESSPESRRYLDLLGHRDILVGHVPAPLATVLGFAEELPNVVIANVDWCTQVGRVSGPVGVQHA